MSPTENCSNVNLFNDVMINAGTAMADVVSSACRQVVGGDISNDHVTEINNFADRITAMVKSLRAVLPKVS